MKPTVTIGIPAYNEAANLQSLVPNLLSQRRMNYRLENIVIVSDGSTDGTAKLAKQFAPDIVRFRFGAERLGKPARINEIFALTESDIVIILDADVKPANESVIDFLVALSGKSSHTFVSGQSRPLKPENYIQKIALAGTQIWDRARKITPDCGMYYADGAIRAFSKSVYKNMHFPDTSADDAFAYLYSITQGWSFYYQPRARVYYRLPSIWSDYRQQQRRYLSSPAIQLSHFQKDLTGRCFCITSVSKFKAALYNLTVNPVFTVLYLFYILYIKIDLSIRPEDFSCKWKILKSTKSVNI